MKRDVRITILKSEVDERLAEEYAIPNFDPCPFHKAGQVFVSDGEHKPNGLCEYAWKPIEAMAASLSHGELLQPKGAWMRDDDKGVFACVDGLRPVIMLIEAIDAE
ncbi:TIGR04076 family protein [Ellagibacter isourolithinifaciens]|uniref:TIGR04076 family protein n=1 Tax=Ellagibacter isourolithinifaciens TaxID=2137581 RepID=UPI003A8E3134